MSDPLPPKGRLYIRTVRPQLLFSFGANKQVRGLVNFDNHWQFFVIVCGWIGSSNPAKDNNKKVPTNNEKKIENFKTNLFDETSFSGFLGQK